MNRFVLADPQKCIGCRTCEIACVLSHSDSSLVDFDPSNFHPRLNLVKGAKVTTPIMCRQCEDAPCAQVCPNGAITSEGGFVQVKQERCIGCKTCEVACPYGAMNVVSFMVEKPDTPAIFANQSKRAFALKCDLCGGCEGDQACVNVCPTNAIRLVKQEELKNINHLKRDAAANSVNELVAH
ncbi:4Fe-4S dicluster domain-containing protein [Ferrimonas lipolytica]|uniref:4Fe-4S dicluster domain-containing protein n=1 Tax=Ferrimonas lipolytica TaxID=2724191 RepID=A0A6H1UB09_9GAMM|nr:4Fe-4S dicluster domain-containing protein [Ferrimonas lipolytica]QIZ76241.1 4Fe-4S dicluster domain-containing protein [Ferrimonas lipolytica]